MKSLLVKALGLVLVLFLIAPSVLAQNAEAPPLPAPLAALADTGVQIRYLGKELSYDSWVGVHQGNVQYFYLSPDGEALFSGILMDRNGNMLTGAEKDPFAETGLAGGNAVDLNTPPSRLQETPQKRASDFWQRLEDSNWLLWGDNRTAPVLYTFIDPNCPHCHQLLEDLKPVVAQQRIQIRVIPVGIINEQSLKQAAWVLSAPEGMQRLLEHVPGDTQVIPVVESINTRGVQRNIEIMLDWKLESTPFTVYKTSNGAIRVVEGRPKDLEQIIAEMTR